MDYEEILFGLQPILNADTVANIPLQDIYVDSYLKVLDQLAISLRAPKNRDIVRETGLLSNLLRVLNDVLNLAVHDSFNANNVKFWNISSELVRSIANCLVDNNANRNFLMQGSKKKIPLLDYYIPRILKLKQLKEDSNSINNDDHDVILQNLQMRSIVLLKNLSIENENYVKRIAPHVKDPIIKLLQNNLYTFLEDPDTIVLASDLFLEITHVVKTEFSIEDVSVLTNFIKRVSSVIENFTSDESESNIDPKNEQNDEQNVDNIVNDDDDDIEDIDADDDIEEDPNSEIISNLIEALENVLSQESLPINFKSFLTKDIQQNILSSIDNLTQKEFPQKLIVMRRLMSTSGYISSHPSAENVQERQVCCDIINNSQNGYTLATSFILLSNSINSRDDVNIVLNEVSIEQIINSSTYMKDPLQFQGFLDILRKLLNLNNAMFLANNVIDRLFQVLKMCSDQTQYIPQLAQLLDSLLKKLISVLPSGSLYKLFDNDEKSILLQCVLDRGSFISCLLMDKLLVARANNNKSDILNLIWDKIFKLNESVTDQNDGLSIPFLFQLTKTLGIYFKNWDSQNLPITESYVIDKHIQILLQIIETLLPLKDKQDNGSASVYHNGQFMSGMIINILGKINTLTPEEHNLKKICKKFF